MSTLVDLKELKVFLKKRNADPMEFKGTVDLLDYKKGKELCMVSISDNDAKLSVCIPYKLILENNVSIKDRIHCTGTWNYYLSSFVFVVSNIKKINNEEFELDNITNNQKNFKRLTERIDIDDDLKKKLALKYPSIPTNIGIVYNSNSNVSEIVDKFIELKMNVHKYPIDGSSKSDFTTSFETKVNQITENKNLDIILYYIEENDPMIEPFSLKVVLTTTLNLLSNTNTYIMSVIGSPFNYPVVQLICHKVFPSLIDMYNFIETTNKEQIKTLALLDEKCNALLKLSINKHKTNVSVLRNNLKKIQLKHKEAILLDKNKNIITNKTEKAEYIKYYDGSIVPIITSSKNDNTTNKQSLKHHIFDDDDDDLSENDALFKKYNDETNINLDMDDLDLDDTYIDMFKSHSTK